MMMSDVEDLYGLPLSAAARRAAEAHREAEALRADAEEAAAEAGAARRGAEEAAEHLAEVERLEVGETGA